MTESNSLDVATFFNLVEFDQRTITQMADVIHESAEGRRKFDTMLNDYRDGPGANPLTVAIGLSLVNRFTEALEWYAKSPDHPTRHYFEARANAALDRFDAASTCFATAASKGWDALECDFRRAELDVRTGKLDAAQAVVDKHSTAGKDRADWYCLCGMLAEARDARVDAVEHFQTARKLDANHVSATFRAARLLDLMGDDDEAIVLYESLAEKPRTHVNALINLAVMYEDRNDYKQAEHCLTRVLDVSPNHTRARLYMRDVLSSKAMVIDDGLEKRIELRDKLLDTPINDFELSVRARNCLKKMNVFSLGDLLALSESELLSYKNFGETSLNEIKALLTKKGLRLGQRPEEMESSAEAAPAPVPERPPIDVPPGAEGSLRKLVSELELSVRARRCLQRLNISTVGDLLRHSEPELLAIRNFGQTSLVEIKARLGDLGLALPIKR